MKSHTRILTIFIILFAFIFIPILTVYSSVKAQQKPTSNQFENEEEAVAYRKTKATTNLNAMTSYLDTIKKTVDSFTALSSDQKSTLGNEITQRRDWLESKKNEVTSTTTIDAITTLGTDITTYWDEVYVRSIYWSGQLMQAKIDDVYSKFQSVIIKVEAEIASSNKDTAMASSYLEIAKSGLNNLSSKKDMSKAKFDSINDKSTALVSLTQGKQYIREAQSISTGLVTDLETIVYYLEN